MNSTLISGTDTKYLINPYGTRIYSTIGKELIIDSLLYRNGDEPSYNQNNILDFQCVAYDLDIIIIDENPKTKQLNLKILGGMAELSDFSLLFSIEKFKFVKLLTHTNDISCKIIVIGEQQYNIYDRYNFRNAQKIIKLPNQGKYKQDKIIAAEIILSSLIVPYLLIIVESTYSNNLRIEVIELLTNVRYCGQRIVKSYIPKCFVGEINIKDFNYKIHKNNYPLIIYDKCSICFLELNINTLNVELKTSYVSRNGSILDTIPKIIVQNDILYDDALFLLVENNRLNLYSMGFGEKNYNIKLIETIENFLETFNIREIQFHKDGKNENNNYSLSIIYKDNLCDYNMHSIIKINLEDIIRKKTLARILPILSEYNAAFIPINNHIIQDYL